MAFNINAQIILSQPKNLNNVTKQISKKLGKVTKIDLKIGNVAQLTTLNKQLTALNNSLSKLNSGLSSTRGSVSSLGKSFNSTASGVTNAAKAQGTLNSQVTRANQALKSQAGLVGTLGKRFGSVAKQAIAFGAISRPIYDLQRALTGAVKDAVEFEKEIVRISQVTGNTVSQLDNLTTQITSLSKELGISANELAQTSRVIAQAGIRGKDLEQVLTALARSTLAPTFGKITDTTEGLIAAFGQFGLKGKDAEAVLGSLNRVSKEFAVEAEDLISVIRRAGGVFASAAGDTKGTVGALQELTAVFTAVRSSTRESADTIAAGLRTIFSRIQRRSTINFLKQFGIDLVDAQGKFVGIFPAFDQLSQRLSTLINQGDALTLSAIAEELGGIRQIGKLLPAIAQFDKARKALTEAQKGAVEGLGGDVAKALDTIDNRVKRIRESFNALIRQVFESDAFQGFAKSFLNGSQAIIDAASSIFKTIEPILPLLTSLGTIKLGKAIGGFVGGGLGGALGGAASTVTGTATAQNTQKTAAAVVNQNALINTTNSTLTLMTRQLSNLIQINNSGFNTLVSQARGTGRSTVVAGFGGSRRRASGGSIPKFQDGGRVHGPSHAAGGVIAELEGGEYVVPKRYAKGSPKTVRGGRAAKEITSRRPIGILFNTATEADPADTTARLTTGKLKNKASKDRLQQAGITALNLSNIQTSVFTRSDEFKKAQESIRRSFDRAGKTLKVDSSGPRKKADLAIGQLFEDFIISAAKIESPGTANFDLKGASAKSASKIANERPLPDLTDIKLNLSELAKESVVEKALNEGVFDSNIRNARKRAAGGIIQKLATGDIVRANSVGVAILDPDDVADGKAAVSVADIESQLGFNKGTKKGFSGVGKVFKGKNYSIVKQGLNQKTSERFNKVLAEGLIKGVDFAASELSGDLGLGPTTIDQGSKTKFIQSQRSAIRGDLFEAALSSLSNRGRFDSAVDFARPFDFPEGLKGPFADNFSRLPSKFVDAKSSKEAAPDANIRGKILREIAADVLAQDPTIGQRLTQQGGGKKGKSKATGRGFGSLTFAGGGEVPVRISDGEMVVTDPKEVAARKGELQRINKLSAGGFASGTIARGPGTGTSDSIYTTLPEGAFVVNAASTKKYLGLKRGGVARAGRASGAAFASGGETAGAGIGLLFAVQSLTSSLGDASNELNNFVNVIGTAVFALSTFGGLEGLKGLPVKLEDALGKIPGVGPKIGASSPINIKRDPFTGQGILGRRTIGQRFAGRVATFGGAGGTALAAVGGAAGGAAIGKIIGDIAGPLIADSVTGKQQEVLGVKGSASTAQAQTRGAVEGGVKGASTGIGAGAGLGFVLGGPIGAAIGAAIGGVAGSIIGSEIGAANAVYQQEVFKAAKAFKGAADDVQKSLQKLGQDASATGFADLANKLDKQNVKFGESVKKFESKFNNEISVAGESLSILRGVTGQVADDGNTFFDALDGFFGTSLSAANQARQNSIKAFAEAGKLFNPEQLQGLKDSLNTGLEKFFAETDFSGIEGLDEASASAADKLQAAADAGNQLAQSLVRLQDETVRQTLIAQQQQLSQGNAQQRAAGAALSPLIINPSILRNQERYNEFVQQTDQSIRNSVTTFQEFTTDALALNRQLQAARDSSIGYVSDLKEQIDAQNAAAEAAGNYQKAINSVTKELNLVIQQLNEGIANLNFAASQSSSGLSTLEANISAINAGTGVFQLQSFTNPFEGTSDAAKAEADRFFNFIGSNFSEVGEEGLRKFNEFRTLFPQLVAETVEAANAGELSAEGQEPSAPQILSDLEDRLGQRGFALPQEVSDFLEGGASEQGTGESQVLPAARLQELTEAGQIGKVLGESFDTAQKALDNFVDKTNQLIKQSETEIKINVEQLKIQRELRKTLTDLNSAAKLREQKILEGSVAGARGRADTIASAEANVRAKSRAIGGSSNVDELLGRRSTALQAQQELANQFKTGAITLDEYKKKQIELNNEIASTTESLNFLATEAETFSAILEQAGKITSDIGSIEGGLEKAIKAIAEGDVGAQQELITEQSALFKSLQGLASPQEALIAIQALGKEENRALIDAITGRQDAGADLRQGLLRQLGGLIAAGNTPVAAAVANQLAALAALEAQQKSLADQAREVQERQAKAAEGIQEQNNKEIIPLLDQISKNNKTFEKEFNTAVNNFGAAVTKFVNTPPPVALLEAPEIAKNTANTAENTANSETELVQLNGFTPTLAAEMEQVRTSYLGNTSPWAQKRREQLDELIRQAEFGNLTAEQQAAVRQQIEIANFAELERIISASAGSKVAGSVLDPNTGKVDAAKLQAFLTEVEKTPEKFKELEKAVKDFNNAVDRVKGDIADPGGTSLGDTRENRNPFPEANIFAKGGSVFQPRGTDTVPAMLTPGEFVIKKSSVDQYGAGVMQAVNQGNAQIFAATGGKVGKGVIYRSQGSSFPEKNITSFPSEEPDELNLQERRGSGARRGLDSGRLLGQENTTLQDEFLLIPKLFEKSKKLDEELGLLGPRSEFGDRMSMERDNAILRERIRSAIESYLNRVLGNKSSASIIRTPNGLDLWKVPVNMESFEDKIYRQLRPEPVGHLPSKEAIDKAVLNSGIGDAYFNGLGKLQKREDKKRAQRKLENEISRAVQERNEIFDKLKEVDDTRSKEWKELSKAHDAAMDRAKALQDKYKEKYGRFYSGLQPPTDFKNDEPSPSDRPGLRPLPDISFPDDRPGLRPLPDISFPEQQQDAAQQQQQEEVKQQAAADATGQPLPPMPRQPLPLRPRTDSTSGLSVLDSAFPECAGATSIKEKLRCVREKMRDLNKTLGKEFLDAQDAIREQYSQPLKDIRKERTSERAKISTSTSPEYMPDNAKRREALDAIDENTRKQLGVKERERDEKVYNKYKELFFSESYTSKLDAQTKAFDDYNKSQGFVKGRRDFERDGNFGRDGGPPVAGDQGFFNPIRRPNFSRGGKFTIDSFRGEDAIDTPTSGALVQGGFQIGLGKDGSVFVSGRARQSEGAGGVVPLFPPEPRDPRGGAGGGRAVSSLEKLDNVRAVENFRQNYNNLVSRAIALQARLGITNALDASLNTGVMRAWNLATGYAERQFQSGRFSQKDQLFIQRQIDQAVSTGQVNPPTDWKRYHSGGKVKGFSNGGDVPIMAQEGEFVMSRNAVQRLGVGTLSRMNNGLPSFHDGGPVYRQFGGGVTRRGGTNRPQTAVVINGADAAKELNNAIITGGETVKQSWQTLFDTVAEGLNSALGQISTIPNQINTTIAPVQIEGVGSFTDALAAQIVPKIVEQIAPLIGDNTNGGTTEQGAGV